MSTSLPAVDAALATIAVAIASARVPTERQKALAFAAKGIERAYGGSSGLPQLHYLGQQWAAGNKITRAEADAHFEAPPACDECGEFITARRASECGGLCARCEWLVQS